MANTGTKYLGYNKRVGKLTLGRHSRAKHLESRRLASADYRDRVLNAYGNRCACCGEAERKFLCIDHVNNDGHLEKYKGIKRWRRIIKLGFPTSYQILCANCNMGKELNGGICPHAGVRVDGPPDRGGNADLVYIEEAHDQLELLN